MNEFEKAVLEEQTSRYQKNQLIKGKIVKIVGDEAFVDIGQKVEATIKVDQIEGYKEGDEIEAYFTGKRNKDGYFTLTRKNLIIKDKINKIKQSFQEGTPVKAKVLSSSDKGYLVEVEGISGFMPKSLSGSAEKLPDGYTFEAKIVKFEERPKGINYIASRKAILEEEKRKEREKILSVLKEGQIVKGKVKKVTDKGLAVSIEDSLNGFLPRSELSWDNSVKPTDFKEGDEINLMIIEIRKDTPIFSLKRLSENPWEKFEKTVGDVVEAYVKEIQKDGIVVKVDNLEGFIPNSHIAHFNYLSAKKNIKTGQKIQAKIIEIDKEKRRLRLSIKQLTKNPVEAFLEAHPVGSTITAKVKDAKQKVAFIDLGDIEGILRLEDATDNKNIKSISSIIKKEHSYTFKVLGAEKDKIILGLKQVLEDSFNNFISTHNIGDVVDFEVKKLIEKGAIVELENGVEGFIPVSEISKERINIPSDVLSLHQKAEAKIIRIEKDNKKIILSIKQLILDRERKQLEEEKKKQEEEKKKQLLEKLSSKKEEKKEEGQSLGTLGDILRKKLEEKNR